VSGGKQGGIYSNRKSGHYNPAGLGYEFLLGDDVSDRLLSIPSIPVTSDTFRFDSSPATFEIHVARLGKQLAVDHWQVLVGDNVKYVVSVGSWAKYKDASFPSDVQCQLIKDGHLIQTIRYNLIKSISSPEDMLVWHGWKEAAIVKDRDTQTIYTFHKGKLVPNPLFNKPLGARVSGARITVLAIISLIGVGVVFIFERGARRRRSNSA
jgi:hypothetical protein